MEPLHYDDLPKTSAECWELLSESDRRAAVKAFLIHGAEREDDDLLEFKKAVLKHSSIAQIVKFFDVWSMDRQMQKSMQLIAKGKHKEYRGSLVRYWLLVEHRTMIISTLDGAGIPNERGYIPDNFNEVTLSVRARYVVDVELEDGRTQTCVLRKRDWARLPVGTAVDLVWQGIWLRSISPTPDPDPASGNGDPH
jgi:hypothetical protein